MTDVACAGALVRDSRGRLLLVLRRREPAAGTWSLPGGRVHPEEPSRRACAREVLEETGLIVDVGRHVGRVRREGTGDTTYVIDDYACVVVGGELRAATDAADVRWVSDDELRAMPLAPLLAQTLQEWGELTPAGQEAPPHP